MPFSITIVEDDLYCIEILQDSIAKYDDLWVEAIYHDHHSALKGFPDTPTDVMLVDVHLPDESGIHLISTFKSQYPEVFFIICSSNDDPNIIFKALKAGASGYILKTDPFDKIPVAIHEALLGGAPMSAGVAKKVVEHFYKTPNNKLEVLTGKEQQLLALLADGHLYKEIANKLAISIDTVKKHSSNIYKKLHVNNRTEATNIFLDR